MSGAPADEKVSFLRGGWAPAIGVTMLSGAAIAIAFLPGYESRATLFVALGAVYAPLAALGAWWLHRRGIMKRRLMPHRGDITIGALLAAGLYLIALVVHFGFTASGKVGEPWLWRIYLHIGDRQATATFVVGIAVMVIAALEEVVWRGWVQSALAETLTPRMSVVWTTALYALAHAPTVYLLSDPLAGPNPLLVAAALGCGAVWGFLAQRVDRIMPSVVAHTLFTWAVVEYPFWRM